MVLVFGPPEDFSLLVIDDEPALLELMPEIFRDLAVDVLVAGDSKVAMRLLKLRQPRLVFLDLHLRDGNGFQLLEQILRFDPRTEVILMSGDDSPSAALEAVQKGAADCLLKPISVPTLRARVERAIEAARKKKQTSELDAELLASFKFHGLVGRSPRLLDLINKIERIAPHFRAVLVSGPPGTETELVAQALHDLSPCRNGPFVRCYCAALRESHADREIFGYEEQIRSEGGKHKPGLLENADRGTLLLEEIGALPPDVQAKLLGFLQTHELLYGSSGAKKLDVRVIATTGRDLQSEVAERRFREDLYYRLSVIHLTLPALAERKEDLPLLQRHFVERFAAEYEKPISGISRRAQDLLSQYAWLGNIRELESVIASACMICEGQVLDTAHFPTILSASETRKA